MRVEVVVAREVLVVAAAHGEVIRVDAPAVRGGAKVVEAVLGHDEAKTTRKGSVAEAEKQAKCSRCVLSANEREMSAGESAKVISDEAGCRTAVE